MELLYQHSLDIALIATTHFNLYSKPNENKEEEEHVLHKLHASDCD